MSQKKPSKKQLEERDRALREIQQKMQMARTLIEEAQVIADEAQVSFSHKVAYGMGGTYFGDHESREYYGTSDGWVSSSRMC